MSSKSTKTIKYFAYGSNMDPEQMRKRGVKFFSREHAILEGWKLVFNKISSRNSNIGFANIVKDESSVVEGILYEITEEGLKTLDEYEGVPSDYQRIEVEVRKNNGEIVKAEVYVANPRKVKDGLKPSKEYLSHLLKGCDLLSSEYRKKLSEIATAD